MTGNGSRFVSAGYKDLKPFIDVQGKPMIQWIVERMVPQEEDILFICRKEHLIKNPQYRVILEKIAPKAQILEVSTWEKKGPVYDILKVTEFISDEKPTVVTYCDYFMLWNWESFKTKTLENNCDGAIPCYSGFHPHLLPQKNIYASCQTDSEDFLTEIREKYSFNENKFLSRHSPGLYYFRSGSLLKKYYQKAIDVDLSLNGEFYSSLPYNLMVKDSLKVWAPINVDYFCQWGTPEDLNEYLFWTNLVKDF